MQLNIRYEGDTRTVLHKVSRVEMDFGKKVLSVNFDDASGAQRFDTELTDRVVAVEWTRESETPLRPSAVSTDIFADS